MSEPQGAAQGARHATSKPPSPEIPPLVQCGDKGAQRWKRLLGSSPQTLVQRSSTNRTEMRNF